MHALNVTSLQLSKELFKLSGWDETAYFWTTGLAWGKTQEEPYVISEDNADWSYGEYNGIEKNKMIAPAYDAGFLLRQLPGMVSVMKNAKDESPYAAMLPDDAINSVVFASSPEDALAKLAIELFKAGVLTKGGE